MTCSLGKKKNTDKEANKTPFTNGGAAFLPPIPPTLPAYRKDFISRASTTNRPFTQASVTNSVCNEEITSTR